MSALPNSKAPRHGKLFELIRQKNQADTTVARVKNLTIRRISVNEMEQLQRAAARSLRADMQSSPAG